MMQTVPNIIQTNKKPRSSVSKLVKKRNHVRRGFTLAEIIISLGIFVLVFTVMVQNFFLLQHTMQNIEKERTMTMFASSALQTIASDIDEYRIDIRASSQNASTLVLASPDPQNLTRITYAFSQDAGGKTILTRKTSSGDQQEYKHDSFSIKDGFFTVTPKANDRNACKTHPSVTVGLTLEYISPVSGTVEKSMPLQTTFSSPETAYSYLANCS